MENSNGPIENRIRDHPVCSAVAQTTPPPRAPLHVEVMAFTFSLTYVSATLDVEK
jgi:hypothetical protein